MRPSSVISPLPRRALPWAAAAAMLAAAACDPQGPSRLVDAAPGAPAFSRQVAIDQFQQQLDSGPARVRIVLEDTGLAARRVRITRPDQLNRPEKVEGRVTAVSASSLTLALGNLTITFDDSTRFRADDEDGFDERDTIPERERDSIPDNERDTVDDAAGMVRDGGMPGRRTITAADFVARVQAEIDSGRQPVVEARRAAPSTPQAPDDAQFLASSLRLLEERDHPRIEMNVTSANLEVNGSPPPEGWVTVLGLKIEIRDTTDLEANTEQTEGEGEFRGLVKSVNTGDSTAVLDDGTVLHLVTGTEMEDADERDAAGALGSLAEVQAALAAGKQVVAKGEGLLTASNPRTLDVVEVRFGVVMGG